MSTEQELIDEFNDNERELKKAYKRVVKDTQKVIKEMIKFGEHLSNMKDDIPEYRERRERVLEYRKHIGKNRMEFAKILYENKTHLKGKKFFGIEELVEWLEFKTGKKITCV